MFREGPREEHWISISDMMSGLMVIFLFVSVAFMLDVLREKDKIKQIAITYARLQDDLYDDLYEEFKNDLPRWNAELDRRTLAVRFKEPEVLFEKGKAELRPKFKEILKDFFPRYIEILTQPKYKDEISEIRIEGHTSSEWSGAFSKDEAYLQNMILSHERARRVLEFVLFLPEIKSKKEWVKKHIMAAGFSSSRLILLPSGEEDKYRSRRVEFRVITNAEKRIFKIIKEESDEAP